MKKKASMRSWRPTYEIATWVYRRKVNIDYHYRFLSITDIPDLTNTPEKCRPESN